VNKTKKFISEFSLPAAGRTSSWCC